MSATETQLLVEQLAVRLERELGLHYTEQRRSELLAKLSPVAQELGFSDVERCIHTLVFSLRWSPEILSCVVRRLTIGETYFFRDPPLFTLLGRQVLPDLMSKAVTADRPLVIWSAACSSGEEPYTLAMVVDQYLPAEFKPRVRIIATDINSTFLNKAEAGRYSPWSFRAIAPELIERYFHTLPTGDRQLTDDIRNMVEFRTVNLALDSPELDAMPQADLVLCRNVLIYFSIEGIRQTLARLHAKLSPSGWLFVAAQEAGCLPDDLFDLELYPNVFAARKKTVSIKTSASMPPSAAEGARVEDALSRTMVERPAQTGTGLAIALDTSGARILQQAVELYESGDYDGVIDKLSCHDWVLDDSGSAAYCLLTNVHANKRNWQQALDTNQLAIELSPLDASLYYMRATILVEVREMELALSSLRQAIFLDEKYALARVLSSNVLRTLGREEEARQQLITTLRLLERREAEEILPHCDNMSVATVRALVTSMLGLTCRTSSAGGDNRH